MKPEPIVANERASSRRRVLALGLVWLIAVGLVLVGIVEAGPSQTSNTIFSLIALVLVVPTVGVGGILVNRLPRHIVGWLLLAGGFSLAVSTAAGAIADYGLNRQPGGVSGAVGFAILSTVAASIFVGALGGFVPLFFPTGRLPSPRWRPVILLGLVATFTPVITSLFGPFSPGDYPPDVVNPFALGGLGGQIVAFLGALSTLFGAAAIVCVVASIVVRYRRSSGIERAQLKWFAYVGLVVLPALVVGILTGGVDSAGLVANISTLAWVVGTGGLALMPVTIGIAILRYRLYEIDRLVSRTISWAVITLILGATFVAIILVAQAVIAPVTGSNALAVAGSTLLVATLFQPIRRRVQRIVDRRFNRARYDAERTVATLAGLLRNEVDLDQLRLEILAAVTDSVEPIRTSLWLREHPAAEVVSPP
jgi:hypothetical protein